MIAGHAALLAWKSGRPVKIIYDRAEDMAATTKRHPSLTRHRTAVSRDGKLLAMEIDFTVDGGAYATLSSVVLSRGTIHAAGLILSERADQEPRRRTNPAARRVRASARRSRSSRSKSPAKSRSRSDSRPRAGAAALLREGRRPRRQVIRERGYGRLLSRLELWIPAKRDRFARENSGAKVEWDRLRILMHGEGFTYRAQSPASVAAARHDGGSVKSRRLTESGMARTPSSRISRPTL